MNRNWFLASVLLILAACSIGDSSFEVGDDLVNSHSKVFLSDTFSVNLSTIQVDSLQASSLQQVLVGTYEHPSLGKTEITHFFKVKYSEISDDVSFDSLTVRMRYSDYYLGDTMKIVEFSIYQLSSELDIYDKPNTSPDYNYNTTIYPYNEADIVGKVRFRPIPHNDSIEFTLNADFGLEVFNWIQNDENDENSNTNFGSFHKGFALKQTDGDPIVLGFSNKKEDDIQLRLYTHKRQTIEETQKEYALNKETDNSNYSGMSYDRTGTAFENLMEQKHELPASSSNNLAAIQGTTGLMVKLSFPSIEQINGMVNQYLVRTDLILVPEMTENNRDFLPEELYFYYTNKRNEFLPSSALSDGSNNITAKLNKDVLNGEYYYYANITNYIASQMSDGVYDDENGLVVALKATDMYSSSDALIFTSTGMSGKMKTKLNLYFLQND